jgi:hypothetical protein
MYTVGISWAPIPSSAAMLHFSALAFLGVHNFDEFIKLRLFRLFTMAESSNRRSNRSRKPIVHFDDQISQLLVPKKPVKSAKPTKSTQNSIKSPAPPTLASVSAECNALDDEIEELCNCNSWRSWRATGGIAIQWRSSVVEGDRGIYYKC